MVASPTRWIEKFLLRKCRTDGWERPNALKLYPVSEGAGYARDILSAGVDGIRVAEAVALVAAAIWSLRKASVSRLGTRAS